MVLMHIIRLLYKQYWQETTTSNGTFYLYGAYLDVRRLNRLGPTVRILGMIDRLEPKVKTYCLLWFADTKEPVVSKVSKYRRAPIGKFVKFAATNCDSSAMQNC